MKRTAMRTDLAVEIQELHKVEVFGRGIFGEGHFGFPGEDYRRTGGVEIIKTDRGIRDGRSGRIFFG